MEPPQATRRDEKPAAAMGIGLRIGIEVVAALIFGVGVGYGLDRWLGTAPWLLIVFFLLGSASGVLNVYRTVRGYGYAVGFGPPPEQVDHGKAGGAATGGAGDAGDGDDEE